MLTMFVSMGQILCKKGGLEGEYSQEETFSSPFKKYGFTYTKVLDVLGYLEQPFSELARP